MLIEMTHTQSKGNKCIYLYGILVNAPKLRFVKEAPRVFHNYFVELTLLY